MFDLFGSVRVLLKLERICTDNNVFRLHYKATVIMLVVSSLLVTSKQYFGDPIECITKSDTVHNKAINNYCWIHSTFTVPHNVQGTLEHEVPHPGVEKYVPDDLVTYHRYYQWVCFMLFFQAILFSVPHYLWKIWEGGRLRMLAVDLGCPLVGETWSPERKKMLLDYLTNVNHHTHNFYAIRFAICEFLNFVNVVGQIYFLNTFLGGQFAMYGPSVALFTDYKNSVDPMDIVFPKVTKCTFQYFGPSGGLQVLDAMCILPLNIVNEKIFVFLWFWYVILAVVSGIAVFYRIIVAMQRHLRVYLLLAQCRFIQRSKIQTIVNQINFGDWFFLSQLGKNLNPVIFREVLLELATKYDCSKALNSASKQSIT